MGADLIIRGGTVVDGTGAPARRADVAIAGDRVVAVEDNIDARAHREIDADSRVVTPGFVDVHTHLDAQIGWDPLPTSSCWHGITSVVHPSRVPAAVNRVAGAYGSLEGLATRLSGAPPRPRPCPLTLTSRDRVDNAHLSSGAPPAARSENRRCMSPLL